MNTLDHKATDTQSQSVANDTTQLKSESDTSSQFVDNRPEAIAQRKLKSLMANSVHRGTQPIQLQNDPAQELDANTWGALEAQAQEALPHFSDIFDQLVKSTGAKTDKYVKIKMKMVDNPEAKPTAKGKADHKVRRYEKSEHSLSEVAPLKGEERATQKAKGKYKGDYGSILDVVRGTLSFADFKGMVDAMIIVHANEAKLGYEVVRCKQTYQDKGGNTGAQTLYGDVKMNLKELTTGHVCELQFTLETFMAVKQKGHKSYKTMRNANPFGDKVLDAKQGADAKTSGQVTSAIHGSYAAYTDARIQIEKDASGLQDAIKTANDIQKQIAAQ